MSRNKTGIQRSIQEFYLSSYSAFAAIEVDPADDTILGISFSYQVSAESNASTQQLSCRYLTHISIQNPQTLCSDVSGLEKSVTFHVINVSRDNLQVSSRNPVSRKIGNFPRKTPLTGIQRSIG